MSTRTEGWSVELVMRYVCATLVTWIAAAGAQLVVRNDFIIVIALISLLGMPVSLYLRMHSMRIAGFSVSRPLWNTFTVVVFFVCAGIWTVISMSDIWGLIFSGMSQSFWLRFGAEGSLALLMQVFLLFAAFRSFALISDKDATLATVPSFSVLLLLVPVHKGIEVVIYFLLWTLVSTALFALDHRGELHTGTNGIVPAPTPGQDVRMAARGLATVLGAALVAAFSLSALLTSRNAEDRSATESAITNLVGRLAQFAMNSPDSSTGGGPERQIDFSTGPTLPSRALLWQVRVRDSQRQLMRPSYFRLFTLSQYNGSTWTQATRKQKQVPVVNLPASAWPFPSSNQLAVQSSPPPSGQRLEPQRGEGMANERLPDGRVARERPLFRPEGRFFAQGDVERSAPFFGNSTPTLPPTIGVPVRGLLGGGDSSLRQRGFDMRGAWPDTQKHYGRPTAPVSVRIASSSINLGYIPLLPGIRTLFASNGRGEEVRSGNDNSIDSGYIPQGQILLSVSDVPALSEYGFLTGVAPTKTVALTSDSPRLEGAEREQCLKIPQLSSRVSQFAQKALVKSAVDENALGRARRLALAIQLGATYTLRPPTPPTGREATDFFLFDGNRRGYCTHFASALAILCRSQGIPARIVSGFAAQEYTGDGTAILREANAHAWTEVWVDNWGWALVDATPSSDRGDNAPNLFSYWGDWIGFAFNQLEMWGRSRLWLFGIIGATLVVGIYAYRRRERILAWWARRRGKVSSDELTRQEIIAAYDMAASRVSRIFRPRSAFETPDEWLAAVGESLVNSPRSKPFAYQEFEQLTQHYLRALYAPQTPAEDAVRTARALARDVRGRKKAASP